MSDKCPNPKYDKMLYAYELGLLEGTDREQFEHHLLDCEHCFEKASRFADAAELLRESPSVKQVITEQTTQREPIPRLPRRGRFTPIGISLAASVILVILLLKPWQLEFRTDLTATASENRLAVLPFEYLGETDSNLLLGEMVSELIITDLSESSYLQVVSSQRLRDVTRLLRIENPGMTIADLASQTAGRVDANWMLVGRVRQGPEGWLVNSQLVEVLSGLVVSSQEVRGSSNQDIFAIVDSLSADVRQGLTLPSLALDEADPRVADLTTDSFEAYHWYLVGVRQAGRMYVNEAIAAFEKALEFDSTLAMAYYRLSLLSSRDNIYRAAEFAADISQREQLYISAALARVEHNDSAHVATLLKLVERYPDEKDAYERLADYYLSVNQHDSAILHLNHAIAVDSLNKTGYNMLAYTYNDVGDHIRSVEAINRYIALAPEEANPYDTRGDLYAQNGDLTGAIESYSLALAKKPDFTASRYKLIASYIFNGNYDEAELEIDLMEAHSDPESRYSARVFRTRSLMYRGRMKDALEYINGAVVLTHNEFVAAGIDDHKTSLLILRGQAYAAREEYDAAIESVREAIRVYGLIAPENDVSFRYLVAQYLTESGKQDQAEPIIALLRDNFAQTESAPCYRLWASANQLMSQGQTAMAVDSLETATNYTKISNDFYGNYELARAYLADGRVAEAIDRLESLQKSYTQIRLSEPISAAKLIYLLGVAYEEARWHDRAITQYRHFLNVWAEADSGLAPVAEARERLRRLETGS